MPLQGLARWTPKLSGTPSGHQNVCPPVLARNLLCRWHSFYPCANVVLSAKPRLRKRLFHERGSNTMLDNDAFVFDCVCHVFNFDKRNAFGKPGEMFINHLYAFHQVLSPPNERVLTPEEFLR